MLAAAGDGHVGGETVWFLATSRAFGTGASHSAAHAISNIQALACIVPLLSAGPDVFSGARHAADHGAGGLHRRDHRPSA